VKKLFMFIIVSIFYCGLAFAADHTITLTNEQETALTELLSDAGKEPFGIASAETPDAWILRRITEKLNSYTNENLARKFNSLPLADKKKAMETAAPIAKEINE
jgi:hypothetical protein